MSRLPYIFVVLFLLVPHLYANGGDPISRNTEEQPKQKSKHPAVFLIGENSEAFEELSLEYEGSLITACDNDMDIAYQRWREMLCAVEEYAVKKKYDIKGVKTWIKFFWSPDGTLDHIAYHLQPKSKNVSTKDLTKFFNDFVRHYQFPVASNVVYSHYASAAFPNYYCTQKVGN